MLFGGLLIRKKIFQQFHTILGRIAPQHVTESFDGLPAIPVIGPVGNVLHMRPDRFDDVQYAPYLLRGEIGVVQNPVEGFPILVFISEQINRGIHQFDHFVGALDTFGLIFDVCPGKLSASQVYAVEKCVDIGAVLNLKTLFLPAVPIIPDSR